MSDVIIVLLSALGTTVFCLTGLGLFMLGYKAGAKYTLSLMDRDEND
jgi:hypothetical protein